MDFLLGYFFFVFIFSNCKLHKTFTTFFLFECFALNSVNCQDKENEIFYDQTSNWKNKEEKRGVSVVDPADFLSIIRLVALQNHRHREPVNTVTYFRERLNVVFKEWFLKNRFLNFRLKNIYCVLDRGEKR